MGLADCKNWMRGAMGLADDLRATEARQATRLWADRIWTSIYSWAVAERCIERFKKRGYSENSNLQLKREGESMLRALQLKRVEYNLRRDVSDCVKYLMNVMRDAFLESVGCLRKMQQLLVSRFALMRDIRLWWESRDIEVQCTASRDRDGNAINRKWRIWEKQYNVQYV